MHLKTNGVDPENNIAAVVGMENRTMKVDVVGNCLAVVEVNNNVDRVICFLEESGSVIVVVPTTLSR